jgi:hypothetical protein
MAMQKGENPYTRIKRDLDQVIHKIKARKRKPLGSYARDKSAPGIAFADLRAVILTANALGYDVRLTATESSIEMQAVERVDINSEHWNFTTFTV